VRERPAEPEPERPRAAERERPRALEPEPPRERGKPHARAGEPGYVPRRERTRGAEPEFGFGLEPEAETEPGPLEWAELESEIEAEAEAEPGLEPTSEAAPEEFGTGVGKEGPRRRRRRRGRRRDRERGAPEPGGPAPDELEADLEEDEETLDVEAPAGPRRERAFEPAARRPARPVEEEEELVREFDFGEEEEEADRFIGEVEEVEEERARVEEEEIDPGLEEEIRREAEEIAELEREMGLRGTTEARLRRGDEREAEAPGAGRGPGRFTRGRGMAKPPIQEIFRRGDEVLVQVIKESIGTKGPTLSTYISIPGRYLVLMPGLNRVGVSRKIADEGQRRKLREIMNELNPPKGLGFIVRTAGLERTKRELARDLAYLLRLWKVILRRIKKAKGPTPIYQESDMITRTIRDIFTSEIDTIWIDEPQAFERAQEFLRVVMPKFVNRLKLYDERAPLFHKYGIEDEIAKIQRRHVPLPEGGSIVIDQTEALVAIDVNSGNFRVENDAERTAYEMNLRAAKEIARQLRLRDLGGVIVNDFIDMREERHRRGVEKALRDAIKRDRARTKVLRMSAFGLIEMTRQRIRPSLKRSVYEDCPNCNGAGVVKTVESMSIDVMRLLALASHREDVRRVNVSVSAAVATYLNNRKRRDIARIETENNMVIHIRAEENVPAEHLQIDCYDAHSGEIRLFPAPAPTGRRPHNH
jgi:ribonuclease E